MTVEGFGDVTVDISYGGAFYAFVNARRFGLDVSKSRTRDLVDAATAVTRAVKSQVSRKQKSSQLEVSVVVTSLFCGILRLALLSPLEC